MFEFMLQNLVGETPLPLPLTLYLVDSPAAIAVPGNRM